MSPESACTSKVLSPAVPSTVNTCLWLVSRGSLATARSGKRTTQGGPPSGGRKYGTGGDPVIIYGKNTLPTMDVRRRLGDMLVARSLVGAGESRGRMRAGSLPAEKLLIGGRWVV
jgi:hypothetical protein